MNIQKKTVTQIDIFDAPNLDPIRVHIDDIAPGQGRITISCFSRAWACAAYWGSMSGRTIGQFFIDCDPGYLADSLAWGQRLKKHEEAYLIRIIEAVQAALREEASA